MGMIQTLTSVSPTTETNIHTATGDEAISSVRIVNDNASAVTINLSISTSTATQQASGKILADSFSIPADTAYTTDAFAMNTTNEFLVLYASAAVSTIVTAWSE
jgi:hypothetical protein